MMATKDTEDLRGILREAFLDNHDLSVAHELSYNQIEAALTAVESPSEELVSIYSGEHGAYWRENGHGYTRCHYAAWILPREQALMATKHCVREKMIELIPVSGERCSCRQAGALLQEILDLDTHLGARAFLTLGHRQRIEKALGCLK